MERLRQLLRFDGRLSRRAYWRSYLLIVAVVALSWCIGLGAVITFGPIGAVLFLPIAPMVVASFAIIVRRLHDRGKSGWWALPFAAFPLIVSLGLAAETPGASPPGPVVLMSLLSITLSIWGLIEIGFRRGTIEANRYGVDPDGRVAMVALD